MVDIVELLKIKTKPLASEEFISIIKNHFSSLEEADLNALIDVYIGKKDELTIPQCMYIAETIKREVEKLQPRCNQVSGFYFNSLMKVQNDQIVIKKLDIPTDIDVNKEFKDIIGEDFYKKLINYASTGLLFLKFEDKPHQRYKFFHWVETNIDLSLSEDSSNLYLILIKQVWSFKFDYAIDTLSAIKKAFPEDKEISSVEVGLRIFADIYFTIIGNQELKEVFIDRKDFAIKFQNDHSNKSEEKDFNNKINQIKQQLLFGSNYFIFLKTSLKNKIYYAIAIFLANREDNFVKEHDLTIHINDISIVDRFFYAKKFYRSEDFQTLKKQLLQNYTNISMLDYIFLYGTRKESQQILQNYIDETNEIQKVAIISVFLKIFLEQGKIGLKDTKSTVYNKFIKFYQFLLVSIDSGISKHKFDKKCITIQVQRKKKTMNKTFSFDCIHCKSSQCLLSISKRIAADAKQHQVRMKGNNVFSKDPRNQVMYCLDCMQLLPKCSVCLFQVTVYNGYAEQSKKNSTNEKQKNSGQSLENALVWCPKCFHGGHFSHIMKWMRMSEKKCPVFNCKCKCSI